MQGSGAIATPSMRRLKRRRGRKIEHGSGEADLGNRMRDQAIWVRVAADFTGVTPADDPAAANAPSRVYNVGNDHPEELMHVVGFWSRGWVGRRLKNCCRETFWKVRGCRGSDARHRLCTVNADRARSS